MENNYNNQQSGQNYNNQDQQQAYSQDQQYQQQAYQQDQYAQQNYQQPAYQEPYQQNTYQTVYAPTIQQEQPVSIGGWILTYFLTSIPVVGIIMLFVWSFSSSTNKSKANWAKAVLIITAICFVLSIVLSVAFSAGLMSLIAALEQNAGYMY